MPALIQGNGVTDLGKSGTPWTNIYGTNVYQGGVLVANSTDTRFPVADEKAALAGTSGTPSASNKYMTAADRSRVWFLEGRTALTGGGSTKLDGLTTAGVTVPLTVAIMDANGGNPVFRIYELVTGTDAESAPDVIRPDDWATSGSVWKLRTGSGTHESTHLQGSTDEIDGDKLAISYTPTNYTRDISGPETDNVAQLTAHLAGIDNFLATALDTRTGVYRTLTVRGQAFMPGTGTPTVGSVTFGSIKETVATLVDASSKSVIVAIQLPETWDSAVAPKFKLEWSGAGSSGDVAWSVSGRLFASASDLTTAMGTAHNFVDTTAGTDYLKLTSAFAPTLAGSGNLLVLDIQRTGGDAGDTMAASAYLHAVHVQFKESATEPSAW